MKNRIKRLCSLCISLVVLLSGVLPLNRGDESFFLSKVYAAEKDSYEIVEIANYDDLCKFSERCNYDIWSSNIKAVLVNDIEIINESFVPIAGFNGIFDGNGHKIYGLKVDGNYAPAGLFGQLMEKGRVLHLTVSGSICPTGNRTFVGGIVGINNGEIADCVFIGSVKGSQSCGGIAGKNGEAGVIHDCQTSGIVFSTGESGGVCGANEGIVRSCISKSYVNTDTIDPTISTENLQFDIREISGGNNIGALNISNDCGGIAGFSSGQIIDCINEGTVGYQHIGYNLGGIAGRSNGFVSACINKGEVLGRKDVGGIVGMAEPHIVSESSENPIKELRAALHNLDGSINVASEDIKVHSNAIHDSFSALNTSMDNVKDKTEALTDILSDFVDDNIEELNQTILILDNTVSGLNAAAKLMPGVNASLKVTASELNAAAEELEKITTDGGTATEIISSNLKYIRNAGSHVKIAMDYLEDAINQMDKVVDQLDKVLSYLDGVSMPSFRKLGTKAEDAARELYDAIDELTDCLEDLNNAANRAAEVLADDIELIDNQSSRCTDILLDALDHFQNASIETVVSDTSEKDFNRLTQGRIDGCVNYGNVDADVDAGGICGSMQLYDALNPEGDASETVYGVLHSSYEIKEAITESSNFGKVNAKKNYAAGICGYQKHGIISNCNGFGSIGSEAGNYVGGICGFSDSGIRSCYAKCSLKGNSYIGGIIGSPVMEGSDDPSGCSISNCVSMVEVPSFIQFVGAISGYDGCLLENNVYCSPVLGGVNRYSEYKKAYPISYEELLAIKGLPEQFREFTVDFVADNRIIKSYSLAYGDSLEDSSYPETPKKKGCYAKWAPVNLNNITFDKVVEAEYYNDIIALASSQEREDGRPIFIAEGCFSDTDVFRVASSETEVDFQPHGIYQKLHYWKMVSIGTWTLDIPQDGNTEHRVRYLPPQEVPSGSLTILSYGPEGWMLMDTETVGSYVTFVVPAEATQVAIVFAISVVWVAVAILAFILCTLLVIGLVHRGKALRRKRKEARKEQSTEGQTETENNDIE